jgi:hypothetical protein
MATDRCVFAWTPPGVLTPPYISLNLRDQGYELTVRGNRESGSPCAWIVLDRAQLLALREAIDEELWG